MLSYSVEQLVNLNSFFTPACTAVIKQLGLLRRPRYIHRSSRKTFFCSQSSDGTTIPALWSTTRTVAPRTRHQNAVSYRRSSLDVSMATPLSELNGKRGVDFSLLRPVQRFVASSKSKIELLNAQSITNKSCFIHDHILDKGLDYMCITETWHQPNTFSSLNESCPQGYSYLQKARSIGRGGGLSVIYRSDLELSLQPLPELSSFECLAFKCKSLSPVLFLLMYRPPKPNPLFITEMSNLLTTFCTSSADVIILGDMNIHVDTPSCRFAAEFLQLLDCFNLKQLVGVPTHTRGHTLDLVITNSAPLTNLHAYDLGVSDHKAISMVLPSPSSLSKPKRNICFRKLKNINQELLEADLQHLSTHFSSADEAVDYYNSHLSSLLNLHAPVKTRTVTFTRSAPWFTDRLRKMKAAGRVLERRFRASGLTVHKEIYREQQKKYAQSLNEARSQFYSDAIRNSPGNSKQLFSTINHLLKPQSPSLTTTTEEQCNKFMDFFTSKTAHIRSALSGPPTQTVPPKSTVSKPLNCFPEISSEEVQNIIRKMKSSTCPLDPLPTFLVKTHITVLSPLITAVINNSLQTGHVPPVLKNAIITPLLKKPTLDPEVLSNYRPISNLPFISKVLEKAVATHLQNHLKHNHLFEKFQSGFRSAHSTETALVRVTNDLLISSDAGSPSLLILLDLSAAFDTVDHGILLNRLHLTTGLNDTALSWFRSYLTNRTEYISLGHSKSKPHTVTCGVPQGSVLGPILFILYLTPLGQIISRHKISFHCYADDTQLYVNATADPPGSQSSTSKLITCLEEIKVWMEHNFLQLNSSKTEAILVGTPHQVKSSLITSITFSGTIIPLSQTVTNLGVKMDPQLTFEAHINHLCKTSFYHLRNISKVRSILSLSDAEKLVHAFVSSRLDYCNALLIGIPRKSLQRLQYIQNSAARILMRVRKHEHITPILHSLHWLPISTRIEYKVSLLTHQCIYGHAPPYLKELINPHNTKRSVRSTHSNLLHIPRTRLTTMGDRAFCAAAPKLWNALPDTLRAPQSTECFKKGLKTFLFSKAFDTL